MKKLCYTICILILPFLTYAQFKVQVSEIAPSGIEQQAVSEKLSQYILVEIVASDLKNHLRQNREKARVAIPSMDGSLFDIILEEYEIRAGNYKSIEESSSGQIEKPFTECPTYRGTVNGTDSSFVRLLVTEETVEGAIFTTKLGYLYLEPLSNFIAGKANQYVLYNLKNVKKAAGTCASDALNSVIKKSTGKSSSSARTAVSTTCRIIELATEADFEYTQAFGGNPNANILGIINTVDGVYQNDLNIRIVVVHQHFWNTNADPYGNPDMGGLLNEFANHWNANFTNVRRDLAHIFTGRNFGGNLGVAWQSSVCVSPALSYGLTRQDNNSFYTTAHEIGHNLGAGHETSNCGAPNTTVMCPGPNIPNVTFSQNSRNQINNHINGGGGCLLDFFADITGPAALCSSNTYQAIGGSVNGNWTWTTSPNINLNTTTGQTVTATPTGNGIGWIEITQTVGCPITFRRYLTTGPPQIGYIAVDGQPTSNATLCVNNFASVEALPIDYNSSYNWSLSNSGNAYLTNYGSASTAFNAYIADCYYLTLQITNACGSTQTGVTICAQNCFARYIVYPNPAKDYVTVEFENIDNADALPDEIALISEKSTNPIKTVNVQESFNRKTFKNGNQVQFDIRDLPRGIYYLHIKNSRRQDKKLDIIRILLE